jgi:hypothetical protein
MSPIENVSRRSFLTAGIITAGALVLGVRYYPKLSLGDKLPHDTDADNAILHPSVYLGIEPDGSVWIVAHRSEMGTTSRTTLNSFEKKVLPALLNNDIGVLGMKPMGDHIILESKTTSAVECLHYAMNLPTSVVITGCDSLPILQQALQAARSFQPLSSSEVAALLATTAKAAEAGQFELYKTSHQLDGTYANPQWLG